jgi:hypothetical protein
LEKQYAYMLGFQETQRTGKGRADRRESTPQGRSGWLYLETVREGRSVKTITLQEDFEKIEKRCKEVARRTQGGERDTRLDF